MPSSKRQRDLARRRAERQAARRAEERARRRKRVVLGSTIGVGAAVLLGVLLISGVFSGDDKPSALESSPTPSPSASASPGAADKPACGAKQPAAVKKQEFKTQPAMTIDKAKTYTMRVKTSCGEIVAKLFADKAPKTVNSFNFLAGKKFFDGTFCHRMTSGESLTVLQCGDPTGSGSGGPGYSFEDENLPKADASGTAKYARGVLAMANSGPKTNGSQFFLVDKDSALPPNYTIWGELDAASLKVLDKILALGIQGDGGDGPPNQKVYIESFTVTAD